MNSSQSSPSSHSSQPLIELRKIEKIYPGVDGIPLTILKDLNFALSQEKSVAIQGPSGSGKTTLLSILALLDRPSQGEFLFHGENITHLSEDRGAQFRAKKMAMIYQHFHLMPHLNAYENILLAMNLAGFGRADSEAQASSLLEEVGLAKRRHHFPHQLSGGEKQRVAFARALSIKPEVVLADEPSGLLDRETAEVVMNLLFAKVKEHKMGLVLVTHDEILAKRCDQCFHLRQGKLV